MILTTGAAFLRFLLLFKHFIFKALNRFILLQLGPLLVAVIGHLTLRQATSPLSFTTILSITIYFWFLLCTCLSGYIFRAKATISLARVCIIMLMARLLNQEASVLQSGGEKRLDQLDRYLLQR